MIIGITGFARSGKDTVADMIIKERPNYKKMSFADPLKKMIKVGLNLSHDQLHGDTKDIIDPRYGCSPRHMMQTLGTEWGRKLIDNDVWVKAMEQIILNFNTIIPDVRFENEATFIRKRGVLIHVTGRNMVIGSEHLSEQGVMVREGDVTLLNNSSLSYLEKQTLEFLKCEI